jgi:outer membrane receptor for ferrienterochelin and colicins
MGKKWIISVLVTIINASAYGQLVCARIESDGVPVPFAVVVSDGRGIQADEKGRFCLERSFLEREIEIRAVGHFSLRTRWEEGAVINIRPLPDTLTELVISATLSEVSRKESAIPIDVLSPAFFARNPVPSLLEAVGMINGVQPQVNCSVCHTGDIHINGMDGPYTLVLIDGMPIVSGLSTVYGLSGIPISLIDRVEVIKGPAGAIYGSEAMGGVINVITRQPTKAPRTSASWLLSSWGESTLDVGISARVGKTHALLGLNRYDYHFPADHNGDGFTDLALQERTSIFSKWSFLRQSGKQASLAGRWVVEDRWGGQMNWTPQFLGGDSIYGESIATRRWELLGNYQWPTKANIYTQLSINHHYQDSWYGNTPFLAQQTVGFLQTYAVQEWRRHRFTAGAAFRMNRYDDNTPATTSYDLARNGLSNDWQPGFFLQDEWHMNEKWLTLIGYRMDVHRYHGLVHSPRLALRYMPNKRSVWRLGSARGFRLVNLFTEDHAALSGAREVIVSEALRPESSWNVYMGGQRQFTGRHVDVEVEGTIFYTHFNNRIVGDFDSDPQKIIYSNLNGAGVSQGVTLQAKAQFVFPLTIRIGGMYNESFLWEENVLSWVIHTPRWSGVFQAAWCFSKSWTLDFTGEWRGPMRLPVFPKDFRPEYSPWFCIANMQVSKKWSHRWEARFGVQNLFDFTPLHPIMRPFDPFDLTVNDTANNPNGYTFDPSYTFASMQGRRWFIGLNYTLK